MRLIVHGVAIDPTGWPEEHPGGRTPTSRGVPALADMTGLLDDEDEDTGVLSALALDELLEAAR